MKISLYAMTIPVLIRGCDNLSHILDKGESYATEKGIAENQLLSARLYKDMFTLTQQVQYAYFSALEIAEHLSGKKPPMLSYKESTFDELRVSINTVKNYLETVIPVDIEGKEDVFVPLYWDKEHKLPGLEYVQKVGVPNFFFHLTTAYDILRNAGVTLGKEDFLGSFPSA